MVLEDLCDGLSGPLRFDSMNDVWRGTRRRWMRTLAGAGGAVGLYGWRIEPHWVEVVRRPLAVPNLPSGWVGRTVVQLSDIHVGPYVDDDFLAHWFRQIASWKPDLVIYTGDFVSCGWTLSDERFLAAYAEAPHGRLGTCGVLGNHDFGRRWNDAVLGGRFARHLGNLQIRMLQNTVVDFDGLRLLGVDDLWGPHFCPDSIGRQVASERPHLVLCHNPDGADLPVWGDYRSWILSGHTHGGQCQVPLLTPLVLPVKNTHYLAGEYPLQGGRRLYINRGLGHLARLRFAARPEVTVFTLVPSA